MLLSSTSSNFQQFKSTTIRTKKTSFNALSHLGLLIFLIQKIDWFFLNQTLPLPSIVYQFYNFQRQMANFYIPSQADSVSSGSNIASFLVPYFEGSFCTEDELKGLIDDILETERELETEKLTLQIQQTSEQTQAMRQLTYYKILQKIILKLTKKMIPRTKELKMWQGSFNEVSIVQQLTQNLKTSPVISHRQKAIIKAVILNEMSLNEEQFFLLVKQELSQSESKAFDEIISLQILKKIDFLQELQCVSRYYNYECYIEDTFEINFPSEPFFDKELIYNLEESNSLISIYKERKLTEKAQRFQEKVNNHGNNNRIIEWNLKKAKVLLKTGFNTQALEYLSFVESLLGESNDERLYHVKLLQSSLLLNLGLVTQANKLLCQLKEASKGTKNYKNTVMIYILMSECLLKNNLIEESLKYEQEAENLARLHQFSLEEAFIAESYYRIGEYLWEEAGTDIDKMATLNKYFRRALEMLGGIQEPKILFWKMKPYWEYFNEYQLQEPALKPNKKIRKVKIQQEKPKGCRGLSREAQIKLLFKKVQFFVKGNWPALNSLDLQNNEIGYKGCQILSGASWPTLRSLNLNHNFISNQGCKHLGRAQWVMLQQLNLGFNFIDPEGCNHLSRIDWPNLESLNLQYNKINAQGCRHLRRTHWPALRLLNIRNNNIGFQGCIFLKKALWPSLHHFDLTCNKIVTLNFLTINLPLDKSSAYPSLWNIQTLHLPFNQIESIEALSRFEAPFLQFLDLSSNTITKISALTKAKSRVLKKLNFDSNPILQLSNFEYIQAIQLKQLSLQFLFKWSKQCLSLKPIAKSSFKKSQFSLRIKAKYEEQAKKSLQQKNQRSIW